MYLIFEVRLQARSINQWKYTHTILIKSDNAKTYSRLHSLKRVSDPKFPISEWDRVLIYYVTQ